MYPITEHIIINHTPMPPIVPKKYIAAESSPAITAIPPVTINGNKYIIFMSNTLPPN